MSHYQISSETFWDDINRDCGELGGVYILKSIVNDKAVVVPRALGDDPEGILYIGKADSFLDRVIELKKSISPNYSSSNHGAGAKYKANKGYQNRYPYESLHVRLIKGDKGADLERKMLQSYVEGFGEVPPLNDRKE